MADRLRDTENPVGIRTFECKAPQFLRSEAGAHALGVCIACFIAFNGASRYPNGLLVSRRTKDASLYGCAMQNDESHINDVDAVLNVVLKAAAEPVAHLRHDDN